MADQFGQQWLDQARLQHPILDLWHASDAASTVGICRLGRDIVRLLTRHDARQLHYLADMVTRIKKTPDAAFDALYELHVAIMASSW